VNSNSTVQINFPKCHQIVAIKQQPVDGRSLKKANMKLCKVSCLFISTLDTVKWKALSNKTRRRAGKGDYCTSRGWGGVGVGGVALGN